VCPALPPLVITLGEIWRGPSFPADRLSERKTRAPPRLAPGVVNPDSSTGRNPDRSSTDDGIGASAATDTHLGAGNSGSAGSPRGSNKGLS
jgi:hypothetical protein